MRTDDLHIRDCLIFCLDRIDISRFSIEDSIECIDSIIEEIWFQFSIVPMSSCSVALSGPQRQWFVEVFHADLPPCSKTKRQSIGLIVGMV
jgi:hypothetical protein